eukprot:g6760.t1
MASALIGGAPEESGFLPEVSQSVSRGPNAWYNIPGRKPIPFHHPDEHLGKWGKVKVTVGNDGKFYPQPKPARGVHRKSMLTSKGFRAKGESSRSSKLVTAVEKGDLGKVMSLIETGMNKNSKNEKGLTITMLACQRKYTAIAAYLLGLNVDLGSTASPLGGAKTSALILASETGNEELVHLLLKSGSPVNFAPWSGESPVLFASKHGHDNVIKILLEHSGDPGGKNAFGMTGLHYAATAGYPEVIEELLRDEYGRLPPPVVDDFDQKGFTPLLLSAINGHAVACETLLRFGAKPDLKCRRSKWTPLMYAVQNKWPGVVNVLLRHGAKFEKVYVPGKSLLFLYACEIGSVKIIDAFVKAGCDPNEKNAIGLSALVLATSKRQSEAARFLLSQGANPDERDLKERWTPIKWASHYGDWKTVKCLIKGGANIHLPDPSSSTALMLAATNGHLKTVEILLSPEAEPNADAQNKYDWTALMMAANNNHLEVAECLLKFGANVNLQSNDLATAMHRACREGHLKMVHKLLKYNSDTSIRGADKAPPVFIACERGHFEIVEALFRARPICNREKEENKWTLLHVACHKGHEKIAKFLMKRKNCIIDARTVYGQSPLHLACRWSGNKHIVSSLLSRGAELEARDYGEYGRATPLMFAAMGGSATVIGHLLHAGADFMYKNIIGESAVQIARKLGHNSAASVIDYFIRQREERIYNAEQERLRLEREKEEALRLKLEREAKARRP